MPDEYSFSKQQRLLKPNDFQVVMASPIKIVNSTFVLFIQPAGITRLGLAIPKRQVRTAVQRNMIKRVIRESFRLNYSKLPHSSLVILSRPVITKLNKAEIRRSIDSLWKQLQKKFPSLLPVHSSS